MTSTALVLKINYHEIITGYSYEKRLQNLKTVLLLLQYCKHVYFRDMWEWFCGFIHWLVDNNIVVKLVVKFYAVAKISQIYFWGILMWPIVYMHTSYTHCWLYVHVLKLWHNINNSTPSINAYLGYLENHRAKFHHDLIWNDGDSGFLNSEQAEQQQEGDW